MTKSKRLFAKKLFLGVLTASILTALTLQLFIRIISL